ncbi:peptidoglycan-binding protein [Catellatospora tritici]|uniref:peptidoglycan-binding protein n=1 Tax=Catellatospora tritici TaxID=2851566 RepID=UPI001C2D7752|nr:peptidoglycan-binding protein [Catellatospora tritici]MBV1852852.1 peptidoglycan-binding protein [Catellatospora tritici]
MTGDRPRRRRNTVAAVAGLAVCAAAATAVAVDLDLTGNDPQPQRQLPPATAAVRRQTLVDTQTETGELGYGTSTAVSTRLAGTVTSLPVTGSTINRGTALFRLDNTPVVLLYGTLPAYRPLTPGTRGPDVRQFEQNLAALGYGGFTVDDTYSAGTATAVRKWQQALGLPRTGAVELGRVVYARGAVRVASHSAALGDGLAPGQPVLSYSGAQRVVTVDLSVTDRRLAPAQAPVTIALPDGGTVAGAVWRTETVIDPGDGAQAEARTVLRVTVTADDPKALAGLDEAAVRVAFTASRRENVLTVPVGSLLALAEGGYGVQVVDGSATRVVAVVTGLFSGGSVEVSGDGLAEGMIVGMPA